MRTSIGAIVVHKRDNVATALRPLRSGELIRLRGGRSNSIALIESIPRGHKLALVDIKRDDCVVKYGEVIGKASVFIRKGTYVHIHNLRGRGGLNR
jgi:altronate dehydratase small subunit